MNGKRSKAPAAAKIETGEQVFGNNADVVLTRKIIDRSENPGNPGGSADSPWTAASAKTTFTYRTPEEKRAQRARTSYGVAALVCLGLLGVITYLWAKFRGD